MTTKEEILSIAERLKAIAESLSDEKTENKLTLDEVRALLVIKSRASKENQEVVKRILNSHNAETLSSLDPAHYEAVVGEVKKLHG